MKKLLLIFIIPVTLLVLLWLGITWVIGSGTESGFNAAIQQLNNNLGTASAFTSVTEESYSRGLLSSEAITRITVDANKGNDSGAEAKENEVFLKLQAWHGPLLMTPDGVKIGVEYVQVTMDRDRLPEKIRKIVDEGFKGEEPVKLAVFTGFGGAVSVDASISPFSSTEAGPNSVKFDGLTGELETSVDNSMAKGTINIGALSVEDKKSGTILSMAKAEGAMDYTNLVMRVTGDGTAHMDFPEIKVSTKGDNYALKELHFDNVSKQHEGKLDMISRVSIGGFKGPANGQYGEIISKMDGKLDIEFSAEGMDIETLQSMADAQQKLQKAQDGKGEESETPEQALYEYMLAASSLLQPGYKMKNRISFANKSGKSELGVGIEYSGDKPLFELVTVRDLVNALEVALNLQVVKELVPAKLAEEIPTAKGMGFIVEEGNLYKGTAILGGGELTVNGKATPVFKQMAPMLDMPIPWEQFGIDKSK